MEKGNTMIPARSTTSRLRNISNLVPAMYSLTERQVTAPERSCNMLKKVRNLPFQ